MDSFPQDFCAKSISSLRADEELRIIRPIIIEKARKAAFQGENKFFIGIGHLCPSSKVKIAREICERFDYVCGYDSSDVGSDWVRIDTTSKHAYTCLRVAIS